RAVDQWRDGGPQCVGVANGTGQQRAEMLGVGLVEAVGGADIVGDRGRVGVIEQPLVQALQCEFARTVAWRAVFAGIGVGGFICRVHLILLRRWPAPVLPAPRSNWPFPLRHAPLRSPSLPCA